MARTRNAPAEDVRNLVGRNILLLLLVAPVVGALWWFSADPASTPAPAIGRTEERLRVEAAAALNSLATSLAQKCKYWAKHLYLTCTVPMELVPAVATAMQQSGWNPNKPVPEQAALNYIFAKAGDTATLKCRLTGQFQECTLSIFAPR